MSASEVGLGLGRATGFGFDLGTGGHPSLAASAAGSPRSMRACCSAIRGLSATLLHGASMAAPVGALTIASSGTIMLRKFCSIPLMLESSPSGQATPPAVNAVAALRASADADCV